MSKPIKKEVLLEKERFELKAKSGGGLLRYEVWGHIEGGTATVTRYDLAYINHALFVGDNGRVLGFDNAHGHHHRHNMGKVESVGFVGYEETLERFQKEWTEIVQQLKERK